MPQSNVSRPIDLEGRCALVTGGSRGIGAAAALALAREGADVAVCDLLPSDEVVERIRGMGRKAYSIQADVSRGTDVKEMIRKAVEALGRLDILVNNAGIVHRDTLADTPEEAWDRVVSVILKGTFLCIQAAYPYMPIVNKVTEKSSTSVPSRVSSAVRYPNRTIHRRRFGGVRVRLMPRQKEACWR